MRIKLQAADYRIIAELTDNNRTAYDRKDQIKGMLEDLQRITNVVQDMFLEEGKKTT